MQRAGVDLWSYLQLSVFEAAFCSSSRMSFLFVVDDPIYGGKLALRVLELELSLAGTLVARYRTGRNGQG